ncbi:hypothetical protein [Halorubrum sp. DTA46]|uniref:hypothetical protein n=1 Tax=Halorubrum sp. DTA46 TaxID=3402162 RepID=UPI003AB0BFBF
MSRDHARALRSLVESTGATIDSTAYLDDLHRSDRLLTRAPGVTDWMARVAGDVTDARRRTLGALRLTAGGNRRDAWKRYESLTSRWDAVPLSVDEYDRAAKRVVDGELFADQRDAIEACDVVVINGEGSIYDRRRKGRVLLFLAYVAAEHLDTPTVLVNHTADVSDPIVRDAVATVYPLLDDVVFREPRSAAACEPFVPGDVDEHLGADAAFRRRPVADRDGWASVVDRENYYGVWPDAAIGFDPHEPYVCVGEDVPDRGAVLLVVGTVRTRSVGDETQLGRLRRSNPFEHLRRRVRTVEREQRDGRRDRPPLGRGTPRRSTRPP